MPRSNLLALVCLSLKEPGTGRERRRRRERRSLAGLLVGLTLFVAASASLYLLLHTRLAEWRDPFHARRLNCLRRRALGTDRPFTVVMLGSSRTHFGLRAGLLEQQLKHTHHQPLVAFNLGKPGAGPVMVLYTWRRMCQERVRPDLLLVEVSTFQVTESSARADTSEVTLPATLLSPADLSFVEQYLPVRVNQLRENWLINQFVPWLGYRRVLIASTVPRLLPMGLRQQPIPMVNESGDGTDWVSASSAAARQLATRRSVESLAGGLRGAIPGKRTGRAIRQLLQECRVLGVRVLLVLPPESAVLRQALPADRVLTAERFLQATARKYAATVVDARRWLPDENDFADGVHLTPHGAELFTERLGQEMMKTRDLFLPANR